MNAPCPECGTSVPVPDDAIPGELMICDHCQVELEVEALEPPSLVLFEEEEK